MAKHNLRMMSLEEEAIGILRVRTNDKLNNALKCQINARQKYREGLDPTLLVGIRDVDPKDIKTKKKLRFAVANAFVRPRPLQTDSTPLVVSR